MEKKLKYGILLQVYGELLTDRQREVISSYYDYDLSLAEISQNLGISRQAVLDSIQNGCASLDRYEEVLKILDKNAVIKQKMNELRQNLINKNKEELTEDIDRVISMLE